MVKRTSIKSYSYLFFALMMLVVCWETNHSGAAFAAGPIPQDSIRLRILANSDSPEDQRVKRLIRDELIRHMNAWVSEPQSIDQARAEIRGRLQEIEQLIGRVLRENGHAYGFDAELAVVPFPTKMYGNVIYPAGDYEALRITLGNAEGQNWWCVLFPPLCFVDEMTGEAVAENTTAKKEVRFFLWDWLRKHFA